MTVNQLRIGLLVNPIAGIGGPVGLKGSDGDRAARARALGARPLVAKKVHTALDELARLTEPVIWYTAGGSMGEDILRRHLSASSAAEAVIVHQPAEPSSQLDTQQAAQRILALGVDLLLFAGGDGTARDVLAAVGERVPVLGIPAGVKMHSAVFAVTPRTAGAAAFRFLKAPASSRLCARREVMDREFLADGQPASSPILHGYLQTLEMPSLVQAAKSATGGSSDGAVLAALGKLAAELRSFDVALLGPGATLKALKQELGFNGSLLGVDIFSRGRCIVRDAREDQIWEAVQGQNCCLALGVIGGQGFLLGRGNQQLSPRVLRAVSREHIRILASAEKLAALPASTLYVDSGDDAVDRMLAGYLPVITGPRRSTLCRVASSGEE
jgi:predicted polyphosphate/ATP-dependent NAD kinase